MGDAQASTFCHTRGYFAWLLKYPMGIPYLNDRFTSDGDKTYAAQVGSRMKKDPAAGGDTILLLSLDIRSVHVSC